MEIKKELESLLNEPESGIKKPAFDLEKMKGGKVGGFVISRTFTGMDQLDRQNLVWNYLEKKWPPEKLLKIVTLVTISPEEASR